MKYLNTSRVVQVVSFNVNVQSLSVNTYKFVFFVTLGFLCYSLITYLFAKSLSRLNIITNQIEVFYFMTFQN